MNIFELETCIVHNTNGPELRLEDFEILNSDIAKDPMSEWLQVF